MSPPPPRARVLVAEDEPITGKVLARGLERAGFDVTLVRCGSDAAQKLTQRWDAFVTDWMMPDVDGIDLVRIIRGAGDERTFVVVTSSLASPAVREHALNAGADDFAPKPVDVGALAALLRAGIRTPPGEAAPLASPPAVRDPTDPHLGQTFGGYTLVKKLGAGGMGTVYEGRASDGDAAAVKILHGWATSDATNTRRLLREARLLRDVQSPYVTKVKDSGVDEAHGVPFVAMELLRGQTLDDVLLVKGALEPSVAIALFVDICRGLAAAHEKGIVHRDVKPSNVFLHVDESGEICPKLCDFGVARKAGDGSSTELTQTGTMVGSPKYMSPEQIRSARRVDHRADLWSLGLMMHEALSGYHPWEDQTSIGNIIVRVCTEDVRPLCVAAPWVPRRVSSIVDRALAKDPAARWQSASELARALEPFAASGAVTMARLTSAATHHAAPPPPRRARGIGPWVLGAAAAVMLAATVALGVATVRELARAHAPPAPGRAHPASADGPQGPESAASEP